MTEVESTEKKQHMVELQTALTPHGLTEFTEKAWKRFSDETYMKYESISTPRINPGSSIMEPLILWIKKLRRVHRICTGPQALGETEVVKLMTKEKLHLPNVGKEKKPTLTPQRIEIETPPKQREPTRYGCGEVGHIRPNCPTKGSQGKSWNRKNGRLEKVNAVFTKQGTPEVDILEGTSPHVDLAQHGSTDPTDNRGCTKESQRGLGKCPNRGNGGIWYCFTRRSC
jgi:hypothetical protein